MSSTCCSPSGTCSGGDTGQATTAATAADGHTAVYTVSGMSCEPCKTKVTKLISELEGVLDVQVELATGRVTVRSGGEPDDARIAQVVGDAGYEFAGRGA